MAKYTTGTVSITHDTFTATGVLTTWNADMILAKIRFGADKEWYRIADVSAVGTLTIYPAYLGTDKVASTYEIYKDEFLLNPDVDKYKLLRNMEDNSILFSTHPSEMDSLTPNPQNSGSIVAEAMVGTYGFAYVDGSVEGTINTTTLTGTGTAWLTTPGIGRMSQIKIGNYVYTVSMVIDETTIVLFEPLKESIVAGTEYSISMNNLVVQLSDLPDEAISVYYRYFRMPSPLVNDYDVPDMPLAWHWLLMYGALSIMFLHKGDMNKSQIECENRFTSGINDMKLKVGSFAPDRIYRRKSVDRFVNIPSLGRDADTI
jgi:hypothetical protein